MNFGNCSSMTGSEQSINIRLSKDVVLDDGSNTSATQDTSLSSSSSSSSSSSTCTHTPRDDPLHYDDDLWSPHMQQQRRWQQQRGRNNSWDTTLSGMSSLGNSSSEYSSTPPMGCQVADDYLSRRNKRLEALRASRQERLQQTPPSISQTVVGSSSSSSTSSSLMCMEDHPYYLARQERKFQELKDKMDQATLLTTTATTGTTTMSTPTSSETATTHANKTRAEMSENVPKDLLEELTSAYQLIHRQRLYLQHLLQQQDKVQQQPPPPERVKSSLRSRSSSSSSSSARTTARTTIQQLQTQLIQLEHDKAEREFMLCNRITHDAMQYQDRLKYLTTKVEYWQLRSRNERESHNDEMLKVNRRIQELEQALQSHNQQQQQQQQQQQENILNRPVHLGMEKSVERSIVVVADANDVAVMDKHNNSSSSDKNKSHVDSRAQSENGSSSSSMTLSRDITKMMLSLVLNLHHKELQSQQQQGQQQQQPLPSLSGHISPSVSQGELIDSVMNKHKRHGFLRGYGART